MFVCKDQILDVKTPVWVRDVNRFRSGRREEIGFVCACGPVDLGQS
jgi:hypothetical protein